VCLTQAAVALTVLLVLRALPSGKPASPPMPMTDGAVSDRPEPDAARQNGKGSH
jgi:hypothetical protein